MKKIIIQTIVTIVGVLNYIIPKKSNRMIFYSFPDFSDNSKALFNEMLNQNLDKKYEMVWVVKDLNLLKNLDIKAIPHKSFIAIWYFVRSKYVIKTHSFMGNNYNAKKQVIINLFHGQPLKGIGTTENPPKKMKKNNYTYMPVTSDFFRLVMSVCFNTELSRNVITGLPRNDFLFDSNGILKKMNLLKNYKKIVMWMPTFRKTNIGYNEGEYNETGLPTLQKEDLEILNKYLNKNGILLLVKLHPWAEEGLICKQNYNNIKIIREMDIPKECSLYNLLGSTDALLTDYSSVYIDYLLLEKPIGFVFDDIEEYLKTRGGLYDNLLEYMPGPKIKKLEELIVFFENLLEEKDEYIREREYITKVFHKYRDGNNSKRLIKKLNL